MQELSSRVLCAIMLGSYENLLDLYCRLVDIAVDTVHACTVSTLVKIHYQSAAKKQLVATASSESECTSVTVVFA